MASRTNIYVLSLKKSIRIGPTGSTDLTTNKLSIKKKSPALRQGSVRENERQKTSTMTPQGAESRRIGRGPAERIDRTPKEEMPGHGQRLSAADQDPTMHKEQGREKGYERIISAASIGRGGSGAPYLSARKLGEG